MPDGALPAGSVANPLNFAVRRGQLTDQEARFVALVAAGEPPGRAWELSGGKAGEWRRRVAVSPYVQAALRSCSQAALLGELTPTAIIAVHRALSDPGTKPAAVASLARLVFSAAGLLREAPAYDPLPAPDGPAPPGADVAPLGAASDGELRAIAAQIEATREMLRQRLGPAPIDVTPVPVDPFADE